MRTTLLFLADEITDCTLSQCAHFVLDIGTSTENNEIRIDCSTSNRKSNRIRRYQYITSTFFFVFFTFIKFQRKCLYFPF